MTAQGNRITRIILEKKKSLYFYFKDSSTYGDQDLVIPAEGQRQRWNNDRGQSRERPHVRALVPPAGF